MLQLQRLQKVKDTSNVAPRIVMDRLAKHNILSTKKQVFSIRRAYLSMSFILYDIPSRCTVIELMSESGKEGSSSSVVHLPRTK